MWYEREIKDKMGRKSAEREMEKALEKVRLRHARCGYVYFCPSRHKKWTQSRIVARDNSHFDLWFVQMLGEKRDHHFVEISVHCFLFPGCSSNRHFSGDTTFLTLSLALFYMVQQTGHGFFIVCGQFLWVALLLGIAQVSGGMKTGITWWSRESDHRIEQKIESIIFYGNLPIHRKQRDKQGMGMISLYVQSSIILGWPKSWQILFSTNSGWKVIGLCSKDEIFDDDDDIRIGYK